MNLVEKTLKKLKKMHPYWHKWELLALKEKDEELAKEVGKRLYEDSHPCESTHYQKKQEDKEEETANNGENI